MAFNLFNKARTASTSRAFPCNWLMSSMTSLLRRSSKIRSCRISRPASSSLGNLSRRRFSFLILSLWALDNSSIEQVEERLPHVGVGFLGFVQEKHRVGVGVELVDQPTALVV